MKRGTIVLLAVIVAATASLAAQETAIYKAERGYKAFYEVGYNFEFNEEDQYDPWDEVFFPLFDECNKLSILTSQGFQFNSHFYLGGGIGLEYYTKSGVNVVSMPFFADFRVNFLKKRFTPFWDTRLGGCIGRIDGIYWSTQLGVRLGLPKSHGVYVAAEFSLTSDCFASEDIDTSTVNAGFKIGYEF